MREVRREGNFSRPGPEKIPSGGRTCKMNPRITVVVPVYNTAKYLKACLDSVLSQSFPDFEIVAVNDASTDESPCILAEYAAKDARVRIVDHECNKGLLAARVSGIRAAAGTYLMFLDSDDELLPGILQDVFATAEKHQADIVHFPLDIRQRGTGITRKHLRTVRRNSLPGRIPLQGEEVFRNFFVDHAYLWMVCQKVYRTEICRKAVDFIPDRFCLMAEDFCFYTIYAFLARRYVPLARPGYIYYMDSGISSGQQTTLDKFLIRQSPFQALHNVRNFLRSQNAWTKYEEAFAVQEQKLLFEYVLRWMRFLRAEDRTAAFNFMFREYDDLPLFQAFRAFFSDKDERLLEMLTGDDPVPVPPPEKNAVIARDVSVRETRISPARWLEWNALIRENHYDAVILNPDDDLERLFWDILAVRSAGAAAICLRRNDHLETLRRKGMNEWLMEDRVLRQASLILTPDEDSAVWYRQRNCAAGVSPEDFLPPQRCEQTAALMLLLEQSEARTAPFRIDPAPDGESFIPFFRKLDHLFRKIPSGFRKKTFGLLAGLYNRVRGD